MRRSNNMVLFLSKILFRLVKQQEKEKELFQENLESTIIIKL
jgi:hypothetical protein